MNANDVIECYVTDVAVHLSRKQRNDVAFELRALLKEELQARADADGRDANGAMAIALLQAFGRPVDVAARYRPALPIIDPADGHSFMRAAVVGLAIIWAAGLLMCLRQPVESASDFLRALGQWWGTTVIPSLWWPGVLVVGFGGGAWAQRRWPQTAVWKPRAGDRIHGGRAGLVMGVIGILCGLSVLIDPRWMLDVLWAGRAAPAAYEALTYTDTFRHRQAFLLLALIALNIPLFIGVIMNGRWTAKFRRFETGLGLTTCAAMAWTVLDGPVFLVAASDKTAKFFMVLVIAVTLIDFTFKLYRRVKPSPDYLIQG
jgi:hypothetical protein